jgi:DNA-binding NarL/FixJ family response regulator
MQRANVLVLQPVIVQRLERSARILANPFVRMGMRFEDAMSYRRDTMLRLSRVQPIVREIAVLLSEGYTDVEIAGKLGTSARTVARCSRELNQL